MGQCANPVLKNMLVLLLVQEGMHMRVGVRLQLLAIFLYVHASMVHLLCAAHMHTAVGGATQMGLSGADANVDS